MVKLETQRLRLEAWKKKDAEDLFAYAQNPNVGPPAGWGPHKDLKESKEVIKEIFLKNQVWKIIEKESGRVIGSIGFEGDRHRPAIASKELGYSLAYEYWGRGIMPEAAEAVIRYTFEQEGTEIVAIQTGPENKRSQGVIAKMGFVYEGTQRYAYKTYDGSIRDVLVYSLKKEEWAARVK
ncbi:MAG: GNAT family protein [Anaerovoracaceae bacterium]